MARLSLSDMGIDLTNELAEILILSASDNENWLLGKQYVDSFAGAVLSSDIKLLRELSCIHRSSYPPINESFRKYERNFLRVFDNVQKKIYPITSIDDLIKWFGVEKEFFGWGDIIIQEFQEFKRKKIEYINLDYHPYRYAEEGMPYCKLWLDKELSKNNCPFTKDNAYDAFFRLVDTIRDMASKTPVLL
ncbi:TPA: hypothetical protein MEA92_004750 [Klebsiella aerogenes]|uniref:hypothetical protein n=1 Tax=Klebsiella aerogenes TaxID=548 RepID=UPI0005EEE274|nr:hypothetical protein [Klebsiella aerogenes]KJO59185.1 hypothetical protein SR89_10170 [Klebsiella aerogenes]HBV9945883.1 hypothetical protein [Klebsiella aerogenes]